MGCGPRMGQSENLIQRAEENLRGNSESENPDRLGGCSRIAPSSERRLGRAGLSTDNANDGADDGHSKENIYGQENGERQRQDETCNVAGPGRLIASDGGESAQQEQGSKHDQEQD